MRQTYRWNCLNKPYESEKNYYSYDKCLKEAKEAQQEYEDIIHIYRLDSYINMWKFILQVDNE